MRISDWSSDVCSSDLRVASWRRRAYRRWGISPRPEDVLLWWITGGIRRRDSSIRAAAGRRDGAFRRWRRRPEHGRRSALGRDGRSATPGRARSEEHTSELQSLMRISYDVFCLKKQRYEQTDNKDTTRETQT